MLPSVFVCVDDDSEHVVLPGKDVKQTLKQTLAWLLQTPYQVFSKSVSPLCLAPQPPPPHRLLLPPASRFQMNTWHFFRQDIL